MPPSSTDVTDDDNKTSFALSELNSDQFTISADNNASSNSTVSLLNLFTLSTPSPHKKRKLTATFTWALSRELLPYKAIRDGKNKIWYCFIYKWDTPSLISARAHLGKKYSIKVKAGEVKVKKL